jgi:hypothetical protein
MGERVITDGGRRRVQTFHPRGMRYLEVNVHGDLDAFEIHDCGITRALYPTYELGEFECSDKLLDEVWRMGRDTLDACMEDAYLDCPWRERGLYSGDFLVQFHVNQATYGDVALFRRCIEVFLDGQGPDGWIRPGAHGLTPGNLPDYTATLVMSIWAYYERTGDLEFIRARAEGLRKCLQAIDGTKVADGVLHDCGEKRPYIDRSPVDKMGVSCSLNCFFQRAYLDGGRLLKLLGEEEAGDEALQKARELIPAIRQAFWDDENGMFLDRRPQDVEKPTPSTPANVLPLLFDIAAEEQVERALEFISARMADNLRVAEPTKSTDANVTTYFSFYALGVLFKYGRTMEALEFIRKYYGWMMDQGAWTVWEFMADFASKCHAWGASPTYYLSSQVLGVTQPEPGNPNRLRIAPNPGDLQWAAGTWPHPAGPVRVEWQVVGDKLLLDYAAPEGVEVEIGIPEGEED